jgi:hypothetical protein
MSLSSEIWRALNQVRLLVSSTLCWAGELGNDMAYHPVSETYFSDEDSTLQIYYHKRPIDLPCWIAEAALNQNFLSFLPKAEQHPQNSFIHTLLRMVA